MSNLENHLSKKHKMSESNELQELNSQSLLNNIDYHNLPYAQSVEEFLENPQKCKAKPEYLTMLFNEDDTILTHVVKIQATDAVLALVNTGADVNLPNRKGITPISAAAHKGNIPIMQILIKAGAHVNALNTSGSTALIQVNFDFLN